MRARLVCLALSSGCMTGDEDLASLRALPSFGERAGLAQAVGMQGIAVPVWGRGGFQGVRSMQGRPPPSDGPQR